MNPLQNFNDEELNLSGENDEALVDYVRCNDLGVIFQDQAPSPVNLPEAGKNITLIVSADCPYLFDRNMVMISIPISS